MKVKRGINQDFADFDEIDLDAIEAKEAFTQGHISFHELAMLVGPEEAVAMRKDTFGDEEDGDNFETLFDNPEDL